MMIVSILKQCIGSLNFFIELTLFLIAKNKPVPVDNLALFH
ncbi:hypothetical protein SVI_1696 [Shewanella violacea DSS12]|uniref:Uncharacterized protein n=1 Tax=Shewanella violacea (strain JCM 10179 / CIP 106290 / LMG 19151 / DSS12) TaxID=637905 RepID=D4ZJ18_SHEVD|nr:hypothetical protein SVI_1696 [Shewanella violacea DSS12]